MSKLTDAQLVVLSKASQREDRALEIASPRTTRANKLIDVLIDRGLVTDVASERAMPIWRHAEDTNEPRSLIVSDLGLVAIGVMADEGAGRKFAEVAPAEGASAANGGRASPKTPMVIKLLQRKDGASIANLTAATGWLPHSTRAALTGLRKKGFAIERAKAKDKTTTIYRIVAAPTADKAA